MVLSVAEARGFLDSGLAEAEGVFSLLASIGMRGTSPEEREATRELLIRVLDQQDRVPDNLQGLLQALVREHGLFPYLRDLDELPVADRIALEAHRPALIPGKDVVFHAEQAVAYHHLLEGENVVLSAPTSFGKSLVIDAVVAARPDWCNVAVVVPTVALIDETRRRLAVFGDQYKIITHGSQALGPRNLFVMTQERMLDLKEIPNIDFFAIDEFYKLDPAHGDDRATQLNVLFHRLQSTGAQFYLLGPNIDALTNRTVDGLRATFIKSDFTTVVTDVSRVVASKVELPDRLAEVCLKLGPQTIIFCSGPARARTVASWLLERGVSGGENLGAASQWIGEAYHPDWLVGVALGAGIGMHHGKLPRALAHHIVRLFNERRLPYLICTSTLIEGVNTTARSVIVVDNKIANRRYDYFTYCNIRGRSGRMFQHYVGKVVVFNEPPEETGLTIDVPVVSQGPETSEDILIQMPWEELSASSKQKVKRFYEQRLVSLDTFRANKGVQPDRQLSVAETIAADPSGVLANFRWNRFPTAGQVRGLADLIFELVRPKSSSATVRSAAQMAARLNILRHHQGDIKALVAQDVDRGRSPDDAVEDALDFGRAWAQFHIPRGLQALERIAVDVVGRGRIAEVSGFVRQVEGLFRPPFAAVLEEYGLPLSVTQKLQRFLRLDEVDTLDRALERLRAVPPNPSGLGPFELEMLRDVQMGL